MFVVHAPLQAQQPRQMPFIRSFMRASSLLIESADPAPSLLATGEACTTGLGAADVALS
jgi:hypothetical protein